MHFTETRSYKIAFNNYLRRGTLIESSIKSAPKDSESPSYVWHTMEDGKVRPSHQHLDGQVFRWNDATLFLRVKSRDAVAGLNLWIKTISQ